MIQSTKSFFIWQLPHAFDRTSKQALCAFLRGSQYPERLRELQLPSMRSHILRTALITAYNLFHEHLKLPLEVVFDAPPVNHLREQQFKVQQP